MPIDLLEINKIISRYV